MSGFGSLSTRLSVTPHTLYVVTLNHEDSGEFTVDVHDSTDSKLQMRRTGTYSGQRLVKSGDEPLSIEIASSGGWSYDFSPITAGGAMEASGTGDTVTPIFDPPVAASILVTHEGGGPMTIWLHCQGRDQLIETTTQPLKPSVAVAFGAGSCFWEILGEGGWTLNVEV